MNASSVVQENVAALKEQFEQLFPGKWQLKDQNQRNLHTGIIGIDTGPSRGIARKKISEWAGSASSGKSTVLRTIIANWCSAGMHVVYVDAGNKLIPADWAFVEQGISGGTSTGAIKNQNNFRTLTLLEPESSNGRFWVVRNLAKKGHKQDALWATEQLVRSNLFDVVVFDATDSPSLSSRFYARLQRSLDSSKAALLIVKDENQSTLSTQSTENQSTWGCHTRFSFNWSGPISFEYGLNGIAAMTPKISSSVWKNGMTNNHEVVFGAHATNRLFTHPQVPDRRVPKARTTLKK